MATQKRASRGSSKKATKSTSARSRTGLKAKTASSSRRKRPTLSSRTTSAAARASRKGGVIKRAIKKGISELAKVGS